MELHQLELLDRVIKQIETHPETWDQHEWARTAIGTCGTAFCVAGWTVELARPDLRPEFHFTNYGVHQSASWVSNPKTGERHRIEYLAQDLLGLAEDEAELLFTPGNETVQMIKSVRDELADEYGLVW